MRILFLTHSFNSLSQRLFVELTAQGHDVSVEFDINDAVTAEAVALFRPDVVLAPFLKRAIPECVWRKVPCFVVHPGPMGDRGPSALDWAILEGAREWGVTVLQAEAELDGGPVWATEKFPLRSATKSSLYRNEVADAAVVAVLVALARFEAGGFLPERVEGMWRPLMRQVDRAINWAVDTTCTVLRKIWSADGTPGVRDRIAGCTAYLYDAHPANGMEGKPGEIVARRASAIARATVDGAIWIGHVRVPGATHPFKLPAVRALGDVINPIADIGEAESCIPSDIRYEESDGVGYLHFAFYNGAMGVDACRQLLAAYRDAVARPTRIIVLMGSTDFWSNGMDLNLIEAADNAAEESWLNINAIDDLAEAIIRTTSHVTVAAVQGNAGAGGVFLARAADEVWLREGVILSPHYKDMGNLYGSEYWTYSLPRYAGQARAQQITKARLPMGGREALALGLATAQFGKTHDTFVAEVRMRAASIAASPDYVERLNTKVAVRASDELRKPLAQYRSEELDRMRLNFYGFDSSYHVARYNFVAKVPKSRTPITIARHRDRRIGISQRSVQ